MAYRKFRADHLFTGSDLLGNDAVLITSPNGVVEEIVNVAAAGDDIEYVEGLITPGFINTHCHLELSHMKGVIPQGSGLIPFLTRVIKERHFQKEVIEAAMRNAERELYETGTVAVADICNTVDSIPVKQSSPIYWKNFIEVIGFTDKPAERFNYGLNVLQSFSEQFKKKDAGFDGNALLTPHAPYSVSRELFNKLNEKCGSMVTIHNQETQAENDLYMHADGEMFELYRNLNIDAAFFRKYGKTSVKTYLPWLSKAERIILVHNTFTSKDDLVFVNELSKQTGQQFIFALCIRANEYIEGAEPPLPLLLENRCFLTLGTDSYASNLSLNLLDEMKTLQHRFSQLVKLQDMLKWSTLHGAKALGIEGWAGSFEKNKKPGIVAISHLKENLLTAESTAKRIL